MNSWSYFKRGGKKKRILTYTSLQPHLLTYCLEVTGSPWWNYGSFLWRRKSPGQPGDSEVSSLTKQGWYIQLLNPPPAFLQYSCISPTDLVTKHLTLWGKRKREGWRGKGGGGERENCFTVICCISSKSSGSEFMTPLKLWDIVYLQK